MGKKLITSGNAGLTMVELMIAATIFSSSMVLLSGSMITVTNHNTISEQKAMTTSYNGSVLEDIRGLGLIGILTYEVPVDNPETGSVFIPGIGNAYVNVWAVIPYDIDQGAEGEPVYSNYSRWFLLGSDDPMSIVDPPNPIQIVVEVSKASGGYEGYHEGGIEFSTSTMIAY